MSKITISIHISSQLGRGGINKWTQPMWCNMAGKLTRKSGRLPHLLIKSLPARVSGHQHNQPARVSGLRSSTDSRAVSGDKNFEGYHGSAAARGILRHLQSDEIALGACYLRSQAGYAIWKRYCPSIWLIPRVNGKLKCHSVLLWLINQPTTFHRTKPHNFETHFPVNPNALRTKG